MKTVAGVFDNRTDAERTIEALRDAGVAPHRVSVLTQDKSRAREIASDTGADTATGAATGAGVGAILGGIAGWLAGLGALAIPGIGPIVAAGPIAAALGGAGAGALAGGLVGALTGWGFSESDARDYENRVKRGGILLAVEIPDEEDTNYAEEVMRRYGGERIGTGTAHRRAA